MWYFKQKWYDALDGTDRWSVFASMLKVIIYADNKHSLAKRNSGEECHSKRGGRGFKKL